MSDRTGAETPHVLTVGELRNWLDKHDVEVWIEADSPDDSISGELPSPGVTVQLTSNGYSRVLIHMPN